MSSIKALVKLNFKALLYMMVGSRYKKKNHTEVLALLLIVVLSLYISGTYSFLIASTFAPVGMIMFMPPIMAVMACLFSLMLTAFGGSGIVFGGKDMDFMLSLPISAFSVMLSKVMALYLENLLICFLMMLPCGAAYLYHGGTGGVVFFLSLLFLVIFLAMLPTLLALLVGFVLAWVQSKMGEHALLSNLLYLVFFAITMLFVSQTSRFLSGSMKNSETMEGIFTSWLYPIGLFQKGIYGNVLAAGGFVLMMVIPFLLVVYLFSTQYKSILSRLSSHVGRSDYKLGTMRATGQFKALLKKEFGRLWGSSIYLFNSGIGVIIAIAGSVLACINHNMIRDLLAQIGDAEPIILLCMVMGFILVMINPACSSISLEGKTLWILKEAPIPVKHIFMAKAGVNAILIWGTGIVCIPMLWFAFELTVLQAFALLLLCGAFGLVVPAAGVWVNLRFPKMDAPNDIIVVKQSLAVVVSLFGGFGVIALGVIIYMTIKTLLADIIFILLCAGVLGILGIVLFTLLFRKGPKYFLQL